ncbi:hypothetical protein GCM10022204_42950 [Microlunatus aurantiacus]|uniref:Secreted protein n=1 Tax=Microlunatus aurantiacus TaxID=446786 RepID=A0ABP7EHC7_9ACTN
MGPRKMRLAFMTYLVGRVVATRVPSKAIVRTETPLVVLTRVRGDGQSFGVDDASSSSCTSASNRAGSASRAWVRPYAT